MSDTNGELLVSLGEAGRTRLSLDEASANSWAAFARGYFALYDWVREEPYENDYGLDYPALGLLVMAIRFKQVRDGFPLVDNEHPKL
jgi:hypothetical protein